MWGGGPSWLAPVRAMRNFFGRYGTTGAGMRGLYTGIVPVAVVDRYRDDTEGSLYGMTMFNVTAPNEIPAFAMGSPVDDWELTALNVGQFLPSAIGNNWLTPFVYTPDSTYLPVVNVNPVGFWEPGLITNWAFNLGSVTGLAGSNPTMPARIGFYATGSFEVNPVEVGVQTQGNAFMFDPPIRVYRDVTLGILLDLRLTGTTPSYFCSALYRIRPRTTDGPRTG